jgi:N-acylneuraminate cytidylyltransferase
MNNLAIIPARGGSKRILRKNIKLFLGKPVIAYSIETAISSGLFDEVMVSTDDDEIAKIAIQYGAKVPFMRSNATSNDFATTYDVIDEVLNVYKSRGCEFVNVCCIYPCAPFVSERKLVQAYHILTEENFDSVFPVIRFGAPIQRSFFLGEDKRIKYCFPENANKRSQDLTPTFHDAGQFYWMKIDESVKQGAIVTYNTGCIEISELEGQDIDDDVDWKMAELKYELIQSTK